MALLSGLNLSEKNARVTILLRLEPFIAYAAVLLLQDVPPTSGNDRKTRALYTIGMLTIALVVSSHYLAVIQSLRMKPAAIPAPTTLAELLRNNITIYVDPANLEDMQRI